MLESRRAIVEVGTLQIFCSPCWLAGRERLELAIASFSFSHLQIRAAVDPNKAYYQRTYSFYAMFYMKGRLDLNLYMLNYELQCHSSNLSVKYNLEEYEKSQLTSGAGVLKF